MKKITAFLLIATLLFSFCLLTSCDKDDEAETPVDVVEDKESESPADESKAPADEPESPADEPKAPAKASLYETVSTAIKNTIAANSYEANVEYTLNSDIMGNVSNSVSNYTAKASGANMSVEGKAIVSDYEMDLKYYYDGTWMYFDMYGDCYKRQADINEFNAEAGGIAATIVELPEALFDGVTGTENGNAITVELSVDEATVETLYKDVVTNVVYNIVGPDLNQTTTKDAKITVTVADGFVTAYKLAFTTEIVVGTDRAAYDYVQAIDFVSCGKDVTVVFPAGYEQFSELDWG